MTTTTDPGTTITFTCEDGDKRVYHLIRQYEHKGVLYLYGHSRCGNAQREVEAAKAMTHHVTRYQPA